MKYAAWNIDTGKAYLYKTMICGRRFNRRIIISYLTIFILAFIFLSSQRKSTNIEQKRKEMKFHVERTDCFENIHREQDRVGPGEKGKAVYFSKDTLSKQDLALYERSYNEHGFNEHVNELISLDRSLPEEIPDKVTIEGNLMKRGKNEVLMVPTEILGPRLDGYVSYIPKVVVIRLKERQGLIRARQRGIDAASADVIVVMDSHFEVAEGWYEPLVNRITEDPYLLLVPVVDGIEHDTFQYIVSQFIPEYMDATSFDFYLGQTRSLMRRDYIQSLPDLHDPIKLPAFQGGFFMANKTVFQRLGGYDEGMQTWGGEQMELSFKYWMCGSGIELIPCSRAGHVYRTKVIWHEDINTRNVSNEYRVAEVWMDEYKQFVFRMNGNYSFGVGNVTQRQEVRKINHCKSFQWYLDTISQYVYFYVPRGLKAAGVVVSVATTLCLDGATSPSGQQPVITYGCHFTGSTQYWELSSDHEIRHGFICLTVDGDNRVITTKCHEDGSRLYRWRYTKDDEIQEVSSGKCLTTTKPYDTVVVSPCNHQPNQIWTWKRMS